MRLSTSLGLLTLAGLGLWGLSGRRRFTPMELGGQVVVITGGSRGLGLCIARELAQAGCTLVLVARDEKELERALADVRARTPGVEAVAIACDVSRRDDVEGMVALAMEQYGRIDGLINVAGIIQVGPLEAMTVEDFEQVMAINFNGALYASLAVLKGMRRRQSGWIVNIDSIGGRVTVPHLLPYHASKFALRGFSEGLGVEVAKDNIEVMTVLPGLMRTGSPVNALFKGQQALEFAWFGLDDSLPLLSMAAPEAARRIVEGIRLGKREITLGTFAAFGGLVHDLFPGATIAALEVLDWLLPGHDGSRSEAKRGRELADTQAGPLVEIIERGGKRYNEVPE